ncbi:hypothetical protein Tsubulata_005523 [Turnera subulata]|uniref:S-protein homolog n=1 Tax=Turnera subulata TaxID=218843 RepID=A0A9Q0FU52_9ROSI|nr:hypothetical protein Tsubulata_005523 [Turnera subulata]
MSLCSIKAALLLVVFLVASLWSSAKSARQVAESNNDLGLKFSLFPKWKAVIVFNKLEDGSDFTIHCKSKDDDLGSHVISAGKFYTWNFHVNVWGTTLFFCSVTTKHGSGTYDLYKAENETDLNWSIEEDGVHGLDSLTHFKWTNQLLI